MKPKLDSRVEKTSWLFEKVHPNESIDERLLATKDLGPGLFPDNFYGDGLDRYLGLKEDKVEVIEPQSAYTTIEFDTASYKSNPTRQKE
eukprot:UN34528